MKARLGTKLLLAQLPLGASLIIVGYLAVQTIEALGRSSQAILKDNYLSVLATGRMRSALDDVEVALVSSVLANKGIDVETSSKIERANRRFQNELSIQEGNITEPGEGDLTRGVRDNWVKTRNAIEAIVKSQAGATPRAANDAVRSSIGARFQDEVAPGLSATRAALERVLIMNQDAIVRKSERAGRIADERRTIMLAVVLAAVALGLYASSALTRRLLRPLSILTLAAKRLGSGDFAVRAQIASDDEIGTLGSEFNTMADHLNDYKSSSLGELLQAQQSAQAAIDSLLDPVVVFSADGSVSGFNQAAENVLKFPASSDAPLREIDPSLKALIERVVAQVLAGKGAYVPKSFEEAVLVHGSDGDKFLLPRATPIYESGGSVTGATLVLQDITRLRRFDELKNDLVATVAHEFRTPLTSLRMAVHLCLEKAAGEINERQADLLSAAKDDCQRLQVLVDELLELSRIESGTVQTNLEPVSIAELAEEAVHRQQRLAAEHQVSLVSRVSPFLPQVLADRERVSVIFDNLIVNALRHSPEGESVVVDALPDGQMLRILVVDHGPGVPKEYREKIFEKFFRVPGSKSGSAGLGLYISRQVARSHNGDLELTSEVGKGSTFSFTLPFADEKRDVS